MANTPRLGLRRPEGADNFSITADFQNHADILDDAAIDQTGTLAARPAAAAVPAGTYYFCVDTGDVSRSNGVTWFTLTPGSSCSFSAKAATNQIFDASAETLLIADSESFDLGGNYNPTASTFVAPVNGIYEFKVASMFVRNATYTLNVRMGIKRNGTKNLLGWESGVATGSTSYFMAVTGSIQLNSGDQITAYVELTSPGSGASGTSLAEKFAGKLLAQLP